MLASLAAAATCVLVPVLWWQAHLRDAPDGPGTVHFFNYDQYQYTVPALRYALGRWHADGVPLWMPEQLAGGPFLATQLHGILYPLHWLVLMLPLASVWTLLLLAHAAIAMAGGYVCARAFSVRRSASLLAGVIYTFSGAVTNLWLTTMEPAVVSAAWLPWQLALTRHVLAGGAGRPLAAIGLGAVTALCIVGGHLPNLAIAVVLCGGYAVLHLGWTLRSQGAAVIPPRLALLGLAAVVALGLGAAQWLPTAELLPRTVRAGAFKTAAEGDPLSRLLTPKKLLLGLVDPLPGFAGLANAQFLGVATLGLAFSAWLHRRNRRRAAAIALLAVLVTLIALGQHTPLYRWYFSLLGGSIRAPQRFYIATVLCLALLAGLGADSLTRVRGWWSAMAAVLVVTGMPFLLMAAVAAMQGEGGTGVAAALAADRVHGGWIAALAVPILLPGSWSRRWLRPLLVLVATVLVALELHGSMRLRIAIPATHPDALPAASGAAAFVRGQSDMARVVTPIAFSWPMANPRQVPVRTAMLEGLFSISDYEPLVDRVYSELVWPLSVAGVGAHNAHLGPFVREVGPALLPRLRLLGVGFVLVPETETAWVRLPGPIYADGKVAVYAVADPLPRAYVATAVRVATSAAEVGRAITADPGWFLRRGVMVEGVEPSSGGSDGTVAVLRYEPEAVELEARLSRPGLVVLLDRYDPFWRATVDGIATPILRANAAFRAVAVEAGEHRVRFVYRPWPVYLGAALTAATLGSLAVAGIVFLRRRGRSTRPAPAHASRWRGAE